MAAFAAGRAAAGGKGKGGRFAGGNIIGEKKFTNKGKAKNKNWRERTVEEN